MRTSVLNSAPSKCCFLPVPVLVPVPVHSRPEPLRLHSAWRNHATRATGGAASPFSANLSAVAATPAADSPAQHNHVAATPEPSRMVTAVGEQTRMVTVLLKPWPRHQS